MQLTNEQALVLQQVAAKAGEQLVERVRTLEYTVNSQADTIRDLVIERDELERGRDQLIEQEKVLREKLRQTENALRTANCLIGLGATAPLSKRPATCRHADGGVYEYLGIAKGAGTAKGGVFEIYRDPKDDRLWFRTMADFTDRMTVVS